MKIRYHDDNSTPQKVVSTAQVEMKEARIKRVPLAKYMVLALILLGLGGCLFWFLQHSTITAYGVVSGQLQEEHAPKRVQISKVNVRRGDVVKPGDVLLIYGSPEVAELLAVSSFEVEQAKIELKKQTELYDQKQKRLEDITRLKVLDAATQRDLDLAQQEEQVALRNREQASLALKLAEDKSKITSSGKNRVESPDGEKSTSSGGFLECRALFDGVVMEVPAVAGSHVAEGSPLIVVAGIRDVWVDGYLPLSCREEIVLGAKVRLYPEHGGESCRGVVETTGSAEVHVPPILREKMDQTPYAMYIRIQPTETPHLLPGSVIRLAIERGAW